MEAVSDIKADCTIFNQPFQALNALEALQSLLDGGELHFLSSGREIVQPLETQWIPLVKVKGGLKTDYGA